MNVYEFIPLWSWHTTAFEHLLGNSMRIQLTRFPQLQSRYQFWFFTLHIRHDDDDNWWSWMQWLRGKRMYISISEFFAHQYNQWIR